MQSMLGSRVRSLNGFLEYPTLVPARGANIELKSLCFLKVWNSQEGAIRIL